MAGPEAQQPGEHGETLIGHVPSRVLVSDWEEIFRSARMHIKKDRIAVAAGSFAYRWFLSLFPIIIALLGVTALVNVPRHVTVTLINGVTKALPEGAAGVFTSAIHHSEGRAAGALTAIVIAGTVALWSATSGMVMVEEGLDMAYELGMDRSFIAKRLRALPLLLAAAVLGGGASALIVFGQAIGEAIKGGLPFGGSAFFVGWTVARWIVALVLVNLLLSVLYYVAPNRPRPQWRWISPGAIVGTLLWAAVSLAFSFYTTVSGSYSKTYGAFAGVAILIFWLYLTGLAILLGGEINAAVERHMAGRMDRVADVDPSTPPVSPAVS
jgi:membrane protein